MKKKKQGQPIEPFRAAAAAAAAADISPNKRGRKCVTSHCGGIVVSASSSFLEQQKKNFSLRVARGEHRVIASLKHPHWLASVDPAQNRLEKIERTNKRGSFFSVSKAANCKTSFLRKIQNYQISPIRCCCCFFLSGEQESEKFVKL